MLSHLFKQTVLINNLLKRSYAGGVTFSNADYTGQFKLDKIKGLDASQRYDYLLRELSVGLYHNFDLDAFISAKREMVERRTRFKHEENMRKIVIEMTDYLANNPSNAYQKMISRESLPSHMFYEFISKHSSKLQWKCFCEGDYYRMVVSLKNNDS